VIAFPIGAAKTTATTIAGTPTARTAAAKEPAASPPVRVSSGTAVSRNACAASASIT
jgi:hypothetical protein